MSRVRIGVVGAGLIGRKHIEVLSSGSPDYVLAGIADPSDEARDLAQQLGAPCFASTEELLEKATPDGVVIAVPNQLHVATGLTCIERRVPVLIEKPVADSVADAMRLVETAESAGVPTLTGHHRRHNPIMQRAQAIIDEGELGQIVTATSLWLLHKPVGYHDLSWRREPGGGPVLINAIHEIDCLRMLCGDIESVQAAHSSAVRGFAVEDTAAAILRFQSGALGTLILSDTVSSPWAWETTSGENSAFPNSGEDSIFIGGTPGSLSVPTLQRRWYEPGAESWLKPLTALREPVTPADPFYAQMQNFADVIRGEAEPVLDGRGGVKTLAATLAITESAASGVPDRAPHGPAR